MLRLNLIVMRCISEILLLQNKNDEQVTFQNKFELISAQYYQYYL